MKTKGKEATPAYMATAERLLAEAMRRHNRAADRYERERNGPKRAAMVGQTFEYPRNCYSCPEPGEFWSMYALVTGKDEDGTLRTLQVQTDYMGKTTIEQDTFRLDGNANPTGRWQPCPRATFDAQLRKAGKKIKALSEVVPLGRPRRGKKKP